MRYQIEYDWLILVFIHEITEDRQEIKELIEQIEKADHSNGNIVFLVKDTLLKTVTVPNSGTVSSFFLTLSKLERMDDGSFKFIELKDVPIYNPDKHCWETAFKYIFTKFHSRRKMMITLSHGAGFGINGDLGSVIRPVHTKVITNPDYYLDKQDVDILTSKFFLDIDSKSLENIKRGVIKKDEAGQVCRSLEILWISELTDALQRYLGESMIDILLMVNCYMQLFDAGYLLGRKVRYLVAPEGSILAPGYNYGNLFALLKSRPSLPLAQILSSIVDDYRRSCLTTENPYASLFANSLRHYPSAVAVLKEFVAILNDNLASLLSALAAIRNEKILYVSIADNNMSTNSVDLIDLGQWIRMVAEQLPGIPRLSDLQTEFEGLRKAIVHAYFIGSYYIEHDQRFNPKFGHSGISVYYPESNRFNTSHPVGWCVYFEEQIPDSFKAVSGWDLFLKNYFAALPSDK